MSAPEITRAGVGLRSERGPLLLAVHAVFVCSAVVALALLLSGALMPRGAGEDGQVDP